LNQRGKGEEEGIGGSSGKGGSSYPFCFLLFPLPYLKGMGMAKKGWKGMEWKEAERVRVRGKGREKSWYEEA